LGLFPDQQREKKVRGYLTEWNSKRPNQRELQENRILGGGDYQEKVSRGDIQLPVPRRVRRKKNNCASGKADPEVPVKSSYKMSGGRRGESRPGKEEHPSGCSSDAWQEEKKSL